jgi:choice-of-anchor B domain-containing protein
MRLILLFTLALNFFNGIAQTYSSQNISLISHIDPQSTVGIGTDSRKYSGCWGWVQQPGNKEYAIVGSSAGTYFIDISAPLNPVVCAFVPGKSGCTWREIKTYQNYCYIVSDDAAPNRFQIVDMSPLPSTVTVINDDATTYFERGHTIWIDKDKMYIGSETKQGGAYSPMTIYSLATPSNPVFLRALETDASFIGVVHDMFVNNDTVFASCGNQGLYIFKYNTNNTFSNLGSFINYSSGSAYNHSSYITQNKKTLVFTDEVPASLPLRVLDVQNISNPVQTATSNPHPNTTPHNPYVIGNRWAIVSCYQDGLNIYDINDPSSPWLAGYFDTYPQGGYNMGDYSNSAYRGNWGAYPFFPSGVILACDMQNGVFLLDATQTYNLPITVKEGSLENAFVNLYPNPAKGQMTLISNIQMITQVTIADLLGKTVYNHQFEQMGKNTIDISNFSNGTYIVTLKTNKGSLTKKLIVNN